MAAAVAGERAGDSALLCRYPEPGEPEGHCSPYARLPSAQLNAKFDPKSDFEFSVSFDTMPTIKWKQPYRSIKASAGGRGGAGGWHP